MAVWQIMKKGIRQVEPNSNPPATWFYDDGNSASPGEEDFSTDTIRAYVDAQGKAADGFNYVGQSPQPPSD
ncbi:hypothetical protein LQG66_03890 [Bradyrhizobium ontarionense]|uniref:Transposase n=1 Tax=Bradyrhizobium ontarionense TaxID=2898149 RepID=A0ABY3RF70_9BRAD|nr:hypothetical protein [Bradyrhizobium sp. A19]UFZ05468.1 hypothetical protein LQG66_03890 [Bradyrhizobium sp. A19]